MSRRKIRDHPAIGGYIVLLKKREENSAEQGREDDAEGHDARALESRAAQLTREALQ